MTLLPGVRPVRWWLSKGPTRRAQLDHCTPQLPAGQLRSSAATCLQNVDGTFVREETLLGFRPYISAPYSWGLDPQS